MRIYFRASPIALKVKLVLDAYDLQLTIFEVSDAFE